MSTTDTFKFLEKNTHTSNPQNAAQDFLSEKMAKNKYMSTSDPDNPYSMGEGSTSGGEAYDLDRKVLNQDAIDAAKAKNEGGKLSAEQIRDKFGLDFNEAHAEESHTNVQKGSAVANTGALYGTNGEYVGTIKGFSKQSSDDIHPGAGGISSLQAIDQYAFDNNLEKTDGRVRMSTGWNSYNDVARAVEAVHGENAEVPEPILEEQTPIEHSAEIKQAKDRVQQYETDVMSGKTSQEIFGKGEAMAEDKYVFDATKGASGIGTSPMSASSQDASKATASFLNNKVGETKSKFNLQPQ